MTDFSDWIQSYWFEIGNLMLQFATLMVLVWFGRRMLGILMPSERHAEAQYQAAAPPIGRAAEVQSFNAGLRGLIPMDSAPSQPRARAAYIASNGGGLLHSFVKWLNTPMGNAPVAWQRSVIRRVY